MKFRDSDSHPERVLPPSHGGGLPAGGARTERFQWEVFGPRLVNPTLVKIIAAMEGAEHPITFAELLERLPEVTPGQVRYYFDRLREVGAVHARGDNSKPEPGTFELAPLVA